MNTLAKATLAALLLASSVTVPSQVAVKNALQTPLGRILSDTYQNVLPPELVALIMSYTQYAHSCRKNVPVYSLEVLPDNTVAAGLENGEIHLIDPTADPLDKKATVKIVKEHTGPVTALRWLTDEGLLVSGSTVNGYAILGFEEQRDKRILAAVALLHNPIPLKKSDERIILWDPASQAPVTIIHPQKELKASAVGIYRSKYFDSLFFNQTSICKRTINLATQKHSSDEICECHSRTNASGKRTYDAVFGGYCVEGCVNGTSRIIGAHSRFFAPFNGHTKPIRAIKELEPGLFATAAEDGFINIFSAQPPQHLLLIESSCHRGQIYALAVLKIKDKPTLVAGFADGSLQLYSNEIEESIKEREKAATQAQQ